MPDHRAKNNRRNAAGGLHSIATLQTLANGAKPCERQHMATRFARLENERARLERELMIWRHGGCVVERRPLAAPPAERD